jgi:RimJ/RimL family protein N-acetyltransferase
MTISPYILATAAQMSDDFRIETDRLEVVPGTLTLWDAERDNRKYFEELLRARVPESWPPPPAPDPGEEGWWTWYFIARTDSERVLVGLGGVKGWPTLTGEVQLGCSFLPEAQAHGYGTEGFGALTRWALEQPSVNCVFAEINMDNEPALGVLNHLGFVQVGKGADENLIRFKRE